MPRELVLLHQSSQESPQLSSRRRLSNTKHSVTQPAIAAPTSCTKDQYPQKPREGGGTKSQAHACRSV
eukprot:29516-Eustigmatos_ZCMA.PRE.1